MSPRQLAFLALKDIYHRQAYTDIALDRVLRQHQLKSVDRGLLSELVYGIVRRKRTLDALIDQLGKKKAEQQPPELRIIFQIGLYQLRYLDQIPPSAAVNTTVELAKINGLNKLRGVVNGVLRTYLRQAEKKDPLILPSNPISRLGVLHSFPDWIITIFHSQLDWGEIEQLCTWFNQPATIDLRINPLKTTLEEVKTKLSATGIKVAPIPNLPQALRLIGSVGNIKQLPGFAEGWYSVQDSSAQLVSHFLNPQPGETIIDACAAPGGKTTHIAELMGDRGLIFGWDSHSKRLQKLQENLSRLQLNSVKVETVDSSKSDKFNHQADRVLVDAPCSGLGTLHKRPDIRWRQNPEKIKELSQLQTKILDNASKGVKQGGKLVYATCTLNPVENEEIIRNFLQTHADWKIEIPQDNLMPNFLVTPEGMIKVFPHRHQMDGFFMVKLCH
jgi:16S rRNA (cytosine967-C5)-methyltransferase